MQTQTANQQADKAVMIAAEIYQSALIDSLECPACLVREIAREAGMDEGMTQYFLTEVIRTVQQRGMFIN